MFFERRLVGDLRDDIFTLLGDHDHIVDYRAVANEFILAHGRPDTEESLLTVDIKFRIGDDHFGRLDRVELAQFGLALAPLCRTSL